MSTKPTQISLAALDTVCGGLSPTLLLRARAVASERYIDALNAGNPRAEKYQRQMNLFGR
jgi:hypothetical protein